MEHTDQNHTYKRYDKELGKLKKQVANMGDHVTSQLDLLLEQLNRGGEADFESLVENDVTINGMEVKASKTVIRLLAKRAPVGRDLRFIIASSRIVTDLERIGDEVVAMAKSLADSIHLGICDTREVSSDLSNLIARSMNLLDRALLAAQNEDEKTAQDIMSNDLLRGGGFHEEANKLIVCVREHYDSMEQSFNVALQVNALTRIADHICNICEHVVFLVTGEDIRHQNEGELSES
ncbi:MAG: phosphate signaling complex protein PhoU [Chromatiales bacterium]|jgi:phosphate transport system protein